MVRGFGARVLVVCPSLEAPGEDRDSDVSRARVVIWILGNEIEKPRPYFGTVGCGSIQ